MRLAWNEVYGDTRYWGFVIGKGFFGFVMEAVCICGKNDNRNAVVFKM